VIWAARTKGNEFDPIPEMFHGMQTNLLEKMPATPFYPPPLHQTTGAKGICGVALGDLVDDCVDELLWEVGHGGGRLAGSGWVIGGPDQAPAGCIIYASIPTDPPVSADANHLSRRYRVSTTRCVT